MEVINPDRRIPLYQQLYEILQSEILGGKWSAGDRFPPESELIESCGVSRITVRKVLDMLVKEGLVYRQQGRGTFVAHPALKHGLSRIVNFTEDMVQRGFVPSTRVLFSGLIRADSSLAAALDVEQGEVLARLERIRLADGEPMCLERSHLVHRYLLGILDYDFEKLSLHKIKARKYNIKWIRASQVIRAMDANRELATKLSIKRGAALLYIERVSYSQHNIPMEFLQAYYRSDRYELHNELQGGAG